MILNFQTSWILDNFQICNSLYENWKNVIKKMKMLVAFNKTSLYKFLWNRCFYTRTLYRKRERKRVELRNKTRKKEKTKQKSSSPNFKVLSNCTCSSNKLFSGRALAPISPLNCHDLSATLAFSSCEIFFWSWKIWRWILVIATS